MKRKTDRKLTGYIKVPNWIDDDVQMYDSTKVFLVTALSVSGCHMSFTKSQEELAKLSGLCRNTVAKAIRELTERGILFSTRRHYYSNRLGRIVRSTTRYYIRRCCNEEGNFTLLPRELLGAELTPGEFVAAMHAYRLAGRKGRCWPSLRLFADQIDHAKSTVCRAVKKLHLRQVLSKEPCKKKNKAYSCNSYYPTAWVRKKAASAAPLVSGGPKFEQPQVSKKITKGFTWLKKKKGVGEFGTLYNFEGLDFFENLFCFDGTGVKVSAYGEPELTG